VNLQEPRKSYRIQHRITTRAKAKTCSILHKKTVYHFKPRYWCIYFCKLESDILNFNSKCLNLLAHLETWLPTPHTKSSPEIREHNGFLKKVKIMLWQGSIKGDNITTLTDICVANHIMCL